MEIAESNKVQIPISNLLGKLTKKSFSEKRAVRMDKNTSKAVVAENNEIVSDTAKIMKATSFVNTIAVIAMRIFLALRSAQEKRFFIFKPHSSEAFGGAQLRHTYCLSWIALSTFIAHSSEFLGFWTSTQLYSSAGSPRSPNSCSSASGVYTTIDLWDGLVSKKDLYLLLELVQDLPHSTLLQIITSFSKNSALRATKPLFQMGCLIHYDLPHACILNSTRSWKILIGEGLEGLTEGFDQTGGPESLQVVNVALPSLRTWELTIDLLLLASVNEILYHSRNILCSVFRKLRFSSGACPLSSQEELDFVGGIAVRLCNWCSGLVALKATIVEIAESNKVQIPISNLLGKLTKKSFSEKRAIRMDKNTSKAVVAENNEIVSDTAKIMKATSFVNTGQRLCSNQKEISTHTEQCLQSDRIKNLEV
ncbi:hypothetical protein Tco_1070495 [Tanacetum coccineum]|uniref:Uncharacterized protein n=1 Tax=Tanacetum coccineum TaxID=301880 RepID=A0ABQ5HNR2_9ASTR